MKKLIASMAAVYFLAGVSGPAFAVEPAPAKTPVVKAMKYKKVHHKKKMMKGKKALRPGSTPAAK